MLLPPTRRTARSRPVVHVVSSSVVMADSSVPTVAPAFTEASGHLTALPRRSASPVSTVVAEARTRGSRPGLVVAVGEGGFEPPTACSQSRCAATAPLPVDRPTAYPRGSVGPARRSGPGSTGVPHPAVTLTPL